MRRKLTWPVRLPTMNAAEQLDALAIGKLKSKEEVHLCAQAMAASEPWLTLRRSYEESVQILQDVEKEIYVAYRRAEVVGFIIINMKGAFLGYIQTVCIMPAWRGKGLGSKLIAFAEERIFRVSPNVFMCVSSFNPQAQDLYTRLGYEVVGTLKNYIVAGHDEILLRKTIAPWSEFRPGD
ncbi:MAG: GNAT family N-acetyltransferase [bacterium]